MKEAPSSMRTPVLSGGTLKNRLPTIRPITIICVGSRRRTTAGKDDNSKCQYACVFVVLPPC